MVSYRKKHVKSKISRIKPRKPLFLRLWFWMIILAVIILGLVVYFCIFFQGLQVKNIIISGNQKVQTYDIESLTYENITLKLVNLSFLKVSTKSILTIKSQKISQDILDKFSVIESVEVRKKFPQTIILEIIERKPIGAYCPPQDEEQNCFLVDKNGVAYEQLDGTPHGLSIVRQAWGLGHIFVGEEIINKNIALRISEIQKTLSEKFQLNLVEAFATSPLRMDVTTSENWRIFFDMDTDYDISIQLIKLDLLLSQEISAEERPNLEYIDLRFKDRAFYR